MSAKPLIVRSIAGIFGMGKEEAASDEFYGRLMGDRGWRYPGVDFASSFTT